MHITQFVKSRTVEKTYSYLYIPSWQDYSFSSEKIANDNLETQIAFASICQTDTIYPYGCNEYHSQIAKNYDLSVSPNIYGFSKYQQENTRLMQYTVQEEEVYYDEDAYDAIVSDRMSFINDQIYTSVAQERFERDIQTGNLCINPQGIVMQYGCDNGTNATLAYVPYLDDLVSGLTIIPGVNNSIDKCYKSGSVGHCLYSGLAITGVAAVGATGATFIAYEIVELAGITLGAGAAGFAGVANRFTGSRTSQPISTRPTTINPRVIDNAADYADDEIRIVVPTQSNCVACTRLPDGRTVPGSGSGLQPKINNVDDLIVSSRPGPLTTGKSTQYLRNGGYNEALNDFNSLNPTNIKTYDNGTTVGTLPDGRQINVRSKSSYGEPTLEIIQSNGKDRLKFRYEK